MVSRDTAVHVAAVLIAFSILFVAGYYDVAETGPASVVLFLLFYGLVLGGAHLYLAVRGADGLVPVEARWRYVTVLAVLLVAGAAVFYGGDRTLATIELETIGMAVVVVTTVVYVVTESVAGYRASRPE